MLVVKPREWDNHRAVFREEDSAVIGGSWGCRLTEWKICPLLALLLKRQKFPLRHAATPWPTDHGAVILAKNGLMVVSFPRLDTQHTKSRFSIISLLQPLKCSARDLWIFGNEANRPNSIPLARVSMGRNWAWFIPKINVVKALKDEFVFTSQALLKLLALRAINYCTSLVITNITTHTYPS